MKISVTGTCRGEGKTYQLIRAEHQPGHVIEASSANQRGEKLPCKLLSMDTIPADGIYQYVLVVFTTKCSQAIEFSEVDKTGRICQRVKKTIFSTMSKWASRYNGVFRKELCSLIRNCDWGALKRASILTFDSVVPKSKTWLLRGSLFVSCTEEDKLFIRAVDAMGLMMATTITILSSSIANAEDESTSSLREYRYSIEFPLEEGKYSNICVMAGDDTDPSTFCFEALEPYYRSELEDKYIQAMSDAWTDPAYGRWIQRHRITEKRAELQCGVRFEYEPKFSIVVPLYKTPLKFFCEMADSVISQTYSNWELILVNASIEDVGLTSLIEKYTCFDERIKVVPVTENLGITENTNVGIKECSGEFLCFFDHDDVLEPDILFRYVQALNEYDDIDLLYCDEDKLLPDGRYESPMFKPDFNIDLLRDNNYICHLLTVRRSLHSSLETAGKELDGAQDHSLVLQVAERGRRIHHVPRILYHWRISPNSTAGNASSKPYATQAGVLAVRQHLERLGICAHVECSHGRSFRYKVDYELPADSLVSIVIPTRGQACLRGTLNSLFTYTDYQRFEVVLSCQAEYAPSVRRLIELGGFDRFSIRVLEYAGGFDYSKAINEGTAVTRGDYLLFIHDDIMVSDGDWLEVLLRHAMRSEVGAVGPMICDLDNVIQQAGMYFVNNELVPGFPGLYKEFPGYVYRPLSTQQVSLLGDVCILVKRDTFFEMQGIDACFVMQYGIADFCFRLRQRGLAVVYTPEASVRHRASMSRGRENDLNSEPSHYCEKAIFLKRWAKVLAQGDPYFNKNLSRVPSEACVFKLDSRKQIEL